MDSMVNLYAIAESTNKVEIDKKKKSCPILLLTKWSLFVNRVKSTFRLHIVIFLCVSWTRNSLKIEWKTLERHNLSTTFTICIHTVLYSGRLRQNRQTGVIFKPSDYKLTLNHTVCILQMYPNIKINISEYAKSTCYSKWRSPLNTCWKVYYTRDWHEIVCIKEQLHSMNTHLTQY